MQVNVKGGVEDPQGKVKYCHAIDIACHRGHVVLILLNWLRTIECDGNANAISQKGKLFVSRVGNPKDKSNQRQSFKPLSFDNKFYFGIHVGRNITKC